MTTLTTGDDYYNVTIRETVYADAGNDTIYVYSTGSFINLGSGNDYLATSGSSTTAFGEQGADYFAIGGSSNQIDGGAGNDTIVQQTLGGAVSGNVLRGGDGDDSITVNDDQTAQLYGDAGIDTLTAGVGNQLLDGGTGSDAMAGGAGDDTYIVDDAGDTITENASAGFDTVQTGLVTYTLGNNVEKLTGLLSTGQTLIGSGDDNTILAGSGDDQLDGKGGNDTMAGGLGDDTYYVDSAGDTVTENANEGTDKVIATAAFYALDQNVENLDGDGSVNPNQELVGNALDNIITATANYNYTLRGDAGNDTINALGTGSNDLYGGMGDDIYFAGDNTSVHESANEGFDIVNTTSSIFTLSDNIEKLVGTAATTQYLIGSAGDNEILVSNNVRNFLTGNGGDDNLIVTGNGNNVFDGGAGNDTLQAVGTGNSTMAGGAGDDFYLVANGTASITENANEGTDLVRTYLAYFALADNVENLEGADSGGQQLVGNAGNNDISGNAGADILDSGVGGTDVLSGKGGDDTYKVLHNSVTVTEAANEGTDTVWFYGTTFILSANVENLESKGIAGSTQMLTGNDLINTYTSQSGINSTFNALGGNDIINISDNANHTMDGGDGNDTLNKSGSGTTTMSGGIGDDRFLVSGGANALHGGLGDDYYWVTDASNTVHENADEGIDTVGTNLAAYTLEANVEKLGGTADGQTLTGNGLDNEITTSEGAINVTLNGGGGNDHLLAWGESSTFNGDAGNDTLDGTNASGFNTYAGGAGDDTYILAFSGMLGSDTVTENANEGIDTIQMSFSSFSLSAIANVENLIGTATTDMVLDGNDLNNHITGDAGNDTLTGNAGNDDLDGGAGTDTMTGGTGDDIYHYEAGDTITELAGEGNDTVVTSVDLIELNNFTNFENITLTGSADLSAFGNMFDNIMIGNSGANSLFAGLGGDDILDGGGGADWLDGDAGNDTYITDGGDTINDISGIDTVQSSVTYTLGNDLEKLVLTGTAANGTGNALANTITGNALANTLIGLGAKDTLSGDAGKDILVGGASRDTMTGGAGNDVFDFNTLTETGKTATSRDVIRDFTHLADDIDLKTIDASTKVAGNQAFKFIGTQAFHKIAGELHFAKSDVAGTANDKTFISGDVTGDGIADFQIELTGLKMLTAVDFVL